MDLFSKRLKKPRPTQTGLDMTSVPYDQTAPPLRSPVPVATVSQGLRQVAQNISAPVTNPTLTRQGTELNIHQLERQRAARERAYREHEREARENAERLSTSTSTQSQSEELADSASTSSRSTTVAPTRSSSGRSPYHLSDVPPGTKVSL